MKRALLVVLGLCGIALLAIPAVMASAAAETQSEVSQVTATSGAPMPTCEQTKATTAAAYIDVQDKWVAAAARASALGATYADINAAETILMGTASVSDKQMKLVALYMNSGANGKANINDLNLVYAVIDARTTWQHDVMTENAACGTNLPLGEPTPAVTVNPPGGSVPAVAPETGDGTLSS